MEILTVADRRHSGGVADRRAFGPRDAEPDTIAQYDRTVPERWRERTVPLGERPPAVSVSSC